MRRALLALLLALAAGLVQARPLLLTEPPAGSLGTWASVMAEDGPPLSLEGARARQREGLFHAGTQAVLTRGIGSRPLWLHLELFNPTAESLPFALVTGTTWLDRLNVYVVHDHRLSASWQTGDEYPNAQGLVPGMGFSLPVNFAPGRSDLYLRADTIDPLVLPIELLTKEQAVSQERLVHYGYGFIYGFLIALLAYNFMLFAGLRERSHLYYSLYLATLTLLNISYTGHGVAWLWPAQPLLERYVILVMMVLHSCCGLLFAGRFLALADHAPRALRLIRLGTLAALVAIASCVALGSQLGAARVAFSVTGLFTLCMVLLGILTVRHGRIAGRYFLVAAIFGMLGTAATTFSVWGWLPFNALTYHGVEYGIGIEATLLALALAYRYKEMTAALSRITVSRDVLASEVTERRRVEAEIRIAATAFESQEGMIITDAEGVILRANKAFADSSGYTVEELVGQTPRLLKSGRHDQAFYAEIWETIKRTGNWQGEIWDKRKDGEIYPKFLTITAVKSSDGTITHYVGTHTDITARKLAEDEIKHLAFYDPLTELPNRRLLLDRLQQALASSARSGHNGALLFIDLDNFKTLNDALGHDKGDLLLQQVAQRLAACVREGDTVARLGGDEFVVMLEDLSGSPEEAATQTEAVGEKILVAFNQPYLLAGHKHHGTPSIGATLFSGHRSSIADLLKQADLAMYQAKAAGRNTLRFFDQEMQAIVTDRAALEGELREAVRQQQFVLHYQPQVQGDGRMTGAEVLLRWQHPQRGMVSPAEFIFLAEETGLILPLGHWVLETACAQLAAWANQPQMARLSIAVNVSARQFHNKDFVDQVLAVLDSTGANPQRLKLELTESMLVSNVEDIIAKMTALKVRGVGFSLDDFGTGYSSLSYLKRLPLDQLKIDQNFVRNILIDPNDAAIAKMIVALAESMGLTVIAEGVESEAQRDFLAHQGCHAYQGHLFSHSLPLAEFERFVT